MDDPHEILGVNRDATADEIRSRYRELALRYHPDRNRGDATAEWMFKRINAANEALTAHSGGETARRGASGPQPTRPEKPPTATPAQPPPAPPHCEPAEIGDEDLVEAGWLCLVSWFEGGVWL